MRFPSLLLLGQAAWRGFRRFPIAIILAAKAVILSMRVTHLAYHSTESAAGWYWDAILSCYLGMLLSIAATIWAEKRGGRRAMQIATQAAVLALTAGYYWSLPHELSVIPISRTIVLALGLHWLVAVIGFRKGEVNGFWQFNKRLFLGILTAFLYSAVLCVGFSLALLAINQLFNAKIDEEYYVYCWWMFGGLFSVWVFLAGFPKDYESPATITDYPKGLRVFTQYVLVTLVTVYLQAHIALRGHGRPVLSLAARGLVAGCERLFFAVPG